ncbi:MAG: DUF115 domain-containing protein [Leptospirales bacterium]|nr:DUF115 domain-containing protein [Leptospirales bacterium]
MMNNIFEKNIRTLSIKDNELAQHLKNVTADNIDVVLAKNGSPVPCITAEGKSKNEEKKLFVHSRVDPIREAERFISDIDISNKDLVVVLGFGFGYHCDILLDKVQQGINIVVIERDEALLRKAFESRDLEKLISAENFFIICNPSESLIGDIFKGKSSKSIIFITHRGSSQIYIDYYNNIVSVIKSYISTKDVNIATLARFEKAWGSNIARNIRIIYESSGINQFFNTFNNIPAIVVAAGPSLVQSINFIKENISKAVIIAVDTSYKILIENGIAPHFCLSADPQLINARYYEGTDETKTILISDPTVHPSIFRFFKGRVVLTNIAFDMMKWIDDICGQKGELTHGGSVSTNAYDFAKRIGAKPIFMVGQDLSFTSGLAHARGSYLDEQIHNKTYRFNNAEMYNRRQLGFLPKLKLNGVRGEAVITNQKMMIFQNWFSNRRDPDLINAAYNGVYIDGIKNIPHDKFSFDYPEIDLLDKIESVYKEFSGTDESERKNKLKKRIDKMLDEIEALTPVLERAVNHASVLSEMIETGRDKSDSGKMSFILKKLSEADEYIESMKKSKDLISFSIQRVIHTITEGYELDNSKRDNVGERSLFLYRGLLEGALFNKKILSKMKILV